MQLELPLNTRRLARPPEDCLVVGGRFVRLRLVRNLRARRYALRLGADGSARVTIPRGGSAKAARQFSKRNIPWLEKQLLRQEAQPPRPRTWTIGTEILLRGVAVRLESPNGDPELVRFGTEELRLAQPTPDLRPAIERYLRRLAARVLPPRVLELAALHQLPARRVSVRDQRSRWGSCSRRGTISLNWRLVQAPPLVSDYLILHELAHLKEMNHSRRFWREVARLCPGFAEAERWLKQHSELLR